MNHLFDLYFKLLSYTIAYFLIFLVVSFILLMKYKVAGPLW